MSTSGYVFSRAKQIVDAEVRPVYINTIQGELFQLFKEKSVNKEVQSLLDEMIDIFCKLSEQNYHPKHL